MITVSDQSSGSDRWKCPDCGHIVVDPVTVIAACRCGSERMQMREWPNADDWEAPEWPDDSEYSADPRDVETTINYEHGKQPGVNAGF